MMRLFLLTLSILGMLSLSGKALEKTTRSGLPCVLMRSDHLEAAVVPGTMGTIVELRRLPGRKELFQPYQYTRTTINELLPDEQSVTAWGSRSLLWDGSTRFYQPLNKYTASADKNAVTVTMTGRYVSALPVEFTRELRLEKNSSLIRIRITLKNIGRKTQEFRIWEHLVPNPELALPDVTLIAGAGVRRLGRYQDTEKHTPGLIRDTFKDGNQNRYIVPGGNWIAATAGKTPLTIFLRTAPENLAKDGFFYTHKALAANLHTVEMLLRRVTLKRGEQKTVTIELGVLDGLQTLRFLTKNYGFDFSCKSRTLEWRAAALSPQKSRKMLLKAGKWQKEFTIPALSPGKSVSGKITGVPAVSADQLEFIER